MPPPAPAFGGSGFGGVATAPNDSQSVLALILGILSVTGCCAILGPVAFFIGQSSRGRIMASNGALGGYGLATAGWIMGIIGSVFLALEILYVIVIVIAGISSGGH